MISFRFATAASAACCPWLMLTVVGPAGVVVTGAAAAACTTTTCVAIGAAMAGPAVKPNSRSATTAASATRMIIRIAASSARGPSGDTLPSVRAFSEGIRPDRRTSAQICHHVAGRPEGRQYAFGGQGGGQFAAADLPFHLGHQRAHCRIAVQPGQQDVSDHGPGPVDLLPAALAVELAGRAHRVPVCVDLRADLGQPD